MFCRLKSTPLSLFSSSCSFHPFAYRSFTSSAIMSNTKAFFEVEYTPVGSAVGKFCPFPSSVIGVDATVARRQYDCLFLQLALSISHSTFFPPPPPPTPERRARPFIHSTFGSPIEPGCPVSIALTTSLIFPPANSSYSQGWPHQLQPLREGCPQDCP